MPFWSRAHIRGLWRSGPLWDLGEPVKKRLQKVHFRFRKLTEKQKALIKAYAELETGTSGTVRNVTETKRGKEEARMRVKGRGFGEREGGAIVDGSFLSADEKATVDDEEHPGLLGKIRKAIFG